MRYRFDSYHPLGLRLLALIEAFHARVISHRKVGRLHKGPGQILVAVLPVAAPLALAVTDLSTVYTTAVGSEITHLGKSSDVSRLEHDGQR